MIIKFPFYAMQVYLTANAELRGGHSGAYNAKHAPTGTVQRPTGAALSDLLGVTTRIYCFSQRNGSFHGHIHTLDSYNCRLNLGNHRL